MIGIHFLGGIMSQLLDIQYILKNGTNPFTSEDVYSGEIVLEDSFFEGIVHNNKDEYFIFGLFDLENRIEFVKYIPDVTFAYVIKGQEKNSVYQGEYFVKTPYWERSAGDTVISCSEQNQKNETYHFKIEEFKKRLIPHREELSGGSLQLYYLLKQRSLETHVYRKGYFKK